MAVLRGHPWVYREGIARAGEGLRSGDAVALSGCEGQHLGAGLWDAESPIAVRVFALGDSRTVDAGLIAARVGQAARFRDGQFDQNGETTAYRLCNGEGDRVPGLVLDRYDRACVMRLDGNALLAWVPRLVPALVPLLQERGVTCLALRHAANTKELDAGTTKLTPLWGSEIPERIWVREYGMRMEVDLWRGQKTGAFLDQRENRRRVRMEFAKQARVLNLFSYAGGFSIAAALGGAAHVTSVDLASGAHASAQRSLRENSLVLDNHSFVTSDVFSFLETARAQGRRFDLIISDPPSFAPSERKKPKAVAAYRKLHAAAVAVLEEGGVFCAASCSSHLSAEDFLATLDEAALGGRALSVRAVYGQPSDHPSLAAWPEGRYLKFVVLG